MVGPDIRLPKADAGAVAMVSARPDERWGWVSAAGVPWEESTKSILDKASEDLHANRANRERVA